MPALALVMALAAAQPQALDEGMAGFFGATLSMTILGQWSAERRFAPDHTYSQTGDDAGVGVWRVEHGKICTTASTPGARTYCNEGVGRRPGDAWKDADPVTGATILMRLDEGGPAKP